MSVIRKGLAAAAIVAGTTALAACATDQDDNGEDHAVNTSSHKDGHSSLGEASTSAKAGADKAKQTVTENKQRSVADDQVGKVIKKESLKGKTVIAAPKGAEVFRVTYGARTAHGAPYAATGLVTVPEGKAPAGGWPVLSWAHGTTGIAAKCAPSTAPEDHPDQEALRLVSTQYLQTWLDKGFAVVQPDYEGLGTEGHGTYMDRHSLASAVNELVRAARGEFKFADEWYNTGWSQGGFAAVSAASAKNVPSGLKGTYAIAPGDTFVPKDFRNPAAAKKAVSIVTPENLTYQAYAIQGAMNFNPEIKADDFLSDAGKDVMKAASEKCLTEFKEDNKTPGSKVLIDEPKVDALADHLLSNSMVNMRPTGPVRIFISEDDEIIDFKQISAATKILSKIPGTDVEVIVRKGEGHRDMVRRAIEDQKEFIEELS